MSVDPWLRTGDVVTREDWDGVFVITNVHPHENDDRYFRVDILGPDGKLSRHTSVWFIERQSAWRKL